jgi:hypothetical protein
MRFSKAFWALSANDQAVAIDAELREMEKVVSHGVNARDRRNATRQYNRLVARAIEEGCRLHHRTR